MSKFSKIYVTSAFSLLLSSTATFADVTNAEVWGNWQSYMGSMGYSITANESQVGKVLTVTDVTMSMPTAEDDENLSAILPMLTFTEKGDGSVQIALPPISEIAIDMTLATGEKIDAIVAYAQNGLDMNVTGENGDFNYVYTAADVNLSLEQLMIDGDEIRSDTAKVDVSLKSISGNSSITDGDLRNYTQTLNTAALDYDLAFSDPETGTKAKVKGTLQNLASSSNSMLPSNSFDMTDVSAILDAGFNAAGTFTYQGGTMDLAFDGPDGAGTANTSSTGGAIAIAFGSDGMNYDVSQTGLAINALVPDVPLPITLNMAAAKFNFAMPIQKSDEEQDFALGFTMGDFTVSDMIWGLLDPSAQLPRDPATLALDLSGKAKVLFDFLNPDQAAALQSSGAAPGELNALTLKSLVLDAVGARLTGKGDFTFDNSDLTSFDGMPRPTGAVDLKLVGGNGLLDKLVAMGMLPQEQAMGARMMMGLLAVAGTEPDTLNSKIEINDAGHILANGQRIQ